MLTDRCALGIKEIRFWCFENPGKLLVRSRLANINLRTRSMGFENEYLRIWGRKFFRHFRLSQLLRNGPLRCQFK